MILSTAELPALSAIQECRQEQIFRRGTEVVRSGRGTRRIEAAQTSELTAKQRGLLLAGPAGNEQQRLETVVRNFERRQSALLAE